MSKWKEDQLLIGFILAGIYLLFFIGLVILTAGEQR